MPRVSISLIRRETVFVLISCFDLYCEQRPYLCSKVKEAGRIPLRPPESHRSLPLFPFIALSVSSFTSPLVSGCRFRVQNQCMIDNSCNIIGEQNYNTAAYLRVSYAATPLLSRQRLLLLIVEPTH